MSLGQRLRGWLQGWQRLRLAVRLVLAMVPAVLVALVLLLTLAARPAPGNVAAGPGLAPIVSPLGEVVVIPDSAATGSPAPLLDDGRLFYEPGWGTVQVQEFLAGRPGTLAARRIWCGDQEVSVAHIVAGKALLYGINPKVLLALLEWQSGLVDDPAPAGETLDLAMGYRREEHLGLEAQIDRAVRELFRATRDYPGARELLLSDGRTVPLPGGTNMGSYAVMRAVALSGDEGTLARLSGSGPDSFVRVYLRLFGEDPRLPWPEPFRLAGAPFLTRPYEGPFEVTALFDHHYPFLSEDGQLVTHLGDEAPTLPYDGHDGWDYALDIGVPVLAAADGLVAWAGNLDDGCATIARGVILDHGNHYQTIYWHFSQVNVVEGQRLARGQVIGLAGASGCADGPHLHLGVHFLGRETDPEGWCGPGEDPWARHPAGMVSRALWADRPTACEWPSGSLLVDDGDQGALLAGSEWQSAAGGLHGLAHWAGSGPRSGVVSPEDPMVRQGTVARATWTPDLPQGGRYRVYAFVPFWDNATPDTRAAHYVIRHAGGETVVVVDQSLYVDRWVDLGAYSFSAGRQGFVYLDNLTDEAGFCVWFDAVLWVPEP